MLPTAGCSACCLEANVPVTSFHSDLEIPLQSFGAIMTSIASVTFNEGLLAAFGVCALWLGYFLLWHLVKSQRGPISWPIVGSLPQVLWNYHRFHDWVLDNYNKNGGTVTVQLPLDSLTYIADPRCVEHMLKTNFKNYPKGDRDREILFELLGSGIFNADGEDWSLQRKTAVHEFSVKKLRDHATVVFQEQVEALIQLADQGARQGTAVDLQDLLMRLTLESICHIGFGVRLGGLSPVASESAEASKFAAAFDLANEVATERFVTPVLWKVKRLLGIGREGHVPAAHATIDRFADRVIRRRRELLAREERIAAEKPEELPVEAPGWKVAGRKGTGGAISPGQSPEASDDSSTSDSESESSIDLDSRPKDVEKREVRPGSLKRQTSGVAAGEPQDLLARFLAMRDGKGALYPDSYLRDVILNFIIAGRDTSAAAMTWLFYELTRNPHVEQKIFAELVEVLEAGPAEGSRIVERLTFDKLRKLTYLQAALSETLRLHPSVPQDRKTAVKADVLPDGTRVAPGQFVMWSAYIMGRQPSIWGPDVLEFRPERWLAADGSFRQESSYKFTAFQGGPRLCLGKDLAFLEMKAAAAALVYNFRFQLVPDRQVTYAMALTMHVKGGLPVYVTRRWGA